MNAFLKVLKRGGMMHYQDLGRYGCSHVGVSQGGAIDLQAHCWANYLLGYDQRAVTIEITLGNTSWEILRDGEIVLTGAEMGAKLDGVKISNWSTHKVCRGQVLSLGYAVSGCHAYLGVIGGFVVDEFLGSGSTVVRNDVGAWLEEGHVLKVTNEELQNSARIRGVNQKLTPADFVPDYDRINEIRVLLADGLGLDFYQAFLNNKYKVSPVSDRMGRKLEALCELPKLPGILSEGVSLGCIQLPQNGQPIVLLNDRQTQGGYAKVGNVARVDLPKLVQMRPGTEFRFVPVALEPATDEWREFIDFFGI